MMNLRSQTVKVSTANLLAKLKANLEAHNKEYTEALQEFQDRLLADLKTAVKKVNSTANPADLKNFRFAFTFPQSHAQEYQDVIAMLEMSVEEEIELDGESFRAYVMNQWAWSNQFNTVKALYATSSFLG